MLVYTVCMRMCGYACMHLYLRESLHMCVPTSEVRGMLTSSTALSQRLSLNLELADWLDWLPHKS